MMASYLNAKKTAENLKGRDFAQEAKGTPTCPLDASCPLPAPTSTDALRMRTIAAGHVLTLLAYYASASLNRIAERMIRTALTRRN